MQIRTLIVDDEPLAREKLGGMLSKEADVEIIGECDNGEKALAMIRVTLPDLVFLDVGLPGLSGTDVAAALGDLPTTRLVFVTAHHEYAIQGFELDILDYLLKPLERRRLQKTLEKYRRHTAGGAHTMADAPTAAEWPLRQLIAAVSNRPQFLDRVLIRTGEDIHIIKTVDIDWIEAAGNYAALHIGSKTHLLRDTMTNLEEKLDPQRFLRIHRSQIVNIERIKKMQPLSHGEYLIILANNTELIVTRTYRDNLLQRFEVSA